MAGFTVNTVVISGNLTRDPEIRNLPNGTPVCELGVAVNERIKDETGNWTDRPNYFDVTVWSGMGEWVAKNLSKGSGVVVEGRLRYEAWEKDGQKRSKVKIVANSIVPRDAQSSGGGNGGGFTASRSDVAVDSRDFEPVGVGNGGANPRPPAEDDIPF